MLVIDMEKHKFIPTSEKGKDKPATFYVMPPTRKTALKIQDILQSNFSENEDEFRRKFKFSEYIRILLDDCLVDWENIMDSKGNEIKFSKDKIDLISDIVVLTELANFIDSLGKVGKS